MKIAIISDIHANLPALEAVLAHADSIGVKGYWCLGDLVQFNAFPDEVVTAIRKLNAPCIHGNIDLRVLEMKQQLKTAIFEDLAEEMQPFAWSYNQLSRKNRKFLRKLPEAMRIKFKGHKFLLVHGSPAANDEPLYVDTAEERLIELASSGDAEFILCGHTHKPFTREAGGVLFINPGSVGRPIDHDPRASYVVMDIKKNAVNVEFFRVEFNLSIAVDTIRQAGLPDIYARMVETAITLEEAKALLYQESVG